MGPTTPRNNFVFVPNRLPSQFTRRPEMTGPLPLRGEWDTQSLLGVPSAILSSWTQMEDISWLGVALTGSPTKGPWMNGNTNSLQMENWDNIAASQYNLKANILHFLFKHTWQHFPVAFLGWSYHVNAYKLRKAMSGISTRHFAL